MKKNKLLNYQLINTLRAYIGGFSKRKWKKMKKNATLLKHYIYICVIVFREANEPWLIKGLLKKIHDAKEYM